MDSTKRLGAVSVVIGALVLTACSPADTPSVETPPNTPGPPARVTAHAGNDQSVFLGTRVPLTGGKSTNSNQTGLTYAWTLKDKPADSQATLSDPNIVNPTMTVDVEGTYEATLIVADAQNPSTQSTPDSVIIIASGTNPPPVAIIGLTPLNSVTRVLIRLDGSQSSDDGGNVNFKWTMTKPSGSDASLRDATTVAPSFTPDIEGPYTITLVVNDGIIDSRNPASVTINVAANKAPTAVITESATNKCDTLTWDGTTSTDSDAMNESGDTSVSSYEWSSFTKPDNSTPTISEEDKRKPTISFQADQEGKYKITLTVTDKTGLVDTDTKEIMIPNTKGNQIFNTNGLPGIPKCKDCHVSGPGQPLIDRTFDQLRTAVTSPPQGMNGPTTLTGDNLTNDLNELKNYLDSTQKTCTTNPILPIGI